MPYNAELQALREFFLLFAPQINCRFCGKPIIPPAQQTFGHRRHTKVWDVNFCVHHEDENRENNEFDNLKPAHSSCHRRYHAQQRKKGGESNGEQEKDVQEDGQEKGQKIGGGDHV